MNRISWYWQNLNEKGRGWKHGRAWLNIYGNNHPGRGFRFEWLFGGHFCHAKIMVGGTYGEDDFMIAFALPFLFAFWFSFHGFIPEKFQPAGEDRETGISICEEFIRLQLWHAENWIGTTVWTDASGRKIGGRGFEKMIDWKAAIMGKTHYADRTIKTEPAIVVMPEGLYRAEVRLFESTWTRARWPWRNHPSKLTRAAVEMKNPIPIPGKGESDWDLDDDAVYSMTMPAESAAEAVKKIRESVIQRREKYGWKRPVMTL